MTTIQIPPGKLKKIIIIFQENMILNTTQKILCFFIKDTLMHQIRANYQWLLSLVIYSLKIFSQNVKWSFKFKGPPSCYSYTFSFKLFLTVHAQEVNRKD